MAERGVRSVTDLTRRLKEVDVDISVQQLGRLIDGKAAHWNQVVIEGLLTVLECELGDLWATEVRIPMKLVPKARKVAA
jgi:DNA-binding Xre family transcriptional regulator